MQETLDLTNAYIKALGLTHKIRVFSNGNFYYALYQSTFSPNGNWEELAQLEVSRDVTTVDLCRWIDEVINKTPI